MSVRLGRRGWQGWLALLLLLGLSGCGGMRLIGSQVESISALPAGSVLQGQRYRFDWLPSQQGQPLTPALAQWTQDALAGVGLVRDDAGAMLSVQVQVKRLSYPVDDFGRPVSPGSWGSVMLGNGGMGLGMGIRFPPTNHYQHEVSLILRDLRTQQVVYETRARHQGPWSDDERLVPTLLRAALDGFPNPPRLPRQVNLEIPR
ncbi:MAG: hypothetical protein RIQ97_172 [Pseudomonadota bacterium]|jgi:hypothetical protein